MTLSVVIATMNRPRDLREALASLAVQTRLPDEIVIVDQSRDRLTADVCATIQKTGPLAGRVRYLHQDVPSSARARSRGASEASGDIVSFLDDDVVLQPDYYRHVMAEFAADPAIGAVGGSVLNVTFRGFKWSVRQVLLSLFLINLWNGRMTASGFGYPIYHRPIRRRMQVEMLHGCNMSFRRSTVGDHWFDDWFTGYSFREDAEFSYRVSRRSKVIMIPEARLDHNVSRANRLTPAEVKRMEMRNYAYVWRKHKGSGFFSRLLFTYSLGGLLFMEWIGAARSDQKETETFHTALQTVRDLKIWM